MSKMLKFENLDDGRIIEVSSACIDLIDELLNDYKWNLIED